MNILYVLVSSKNDCYLEQTILSVESLKKIEPNCFISVITDKKTKSTLVGKRKKILRLINKLEVVDVPSQYNQKETSRFLKTKMYDFSESDFLYIDTDTIICNSLSDIEKFVKEFSISACLDQNTVISKYPNKELLEIYAKKNKFHLGYNDKNFNSGVMYVKKNETSAKFFQLWHELWVKGLRNGVSQDQPSLNEVNYLFKGVINELSGEFNCQLSPYGNFYKYFDNAKILHYFASDSSGGVPYLLCKGNFIRQALDENYDSELTAVLNKPKSGLIISYIISDSNIAQLSEYIVIFLRRLYYRHHFIFSFISAIIKNLVILYRKIKY